MYLTIAESLEIRKLPNVKFVVDYDALVHDHYLTVTTGKGSIPLIEKSGANSYQYHGEYSFKDLVTVLKKNPKKKFIFSLDFAHYKSEFPYDVSMVLCRALTLKTGVTHNMMINPSLDRSGVEYSVAIQISQEEVLSSTSQALVRIGELKQKFFTERHGILFKAEVYTRGCKIVSHSFQYDEGIYKSIHDFEKMLKLYQIDRGAYTISVRCSDNYKRKDLISGTFDNFEKIFSGDSHIENMTMKEIFENNV